MKLPAAITSFFSRTKADPAPPSAPKSSDKAVILPDDPGWTRVLGMQSWKLSGTVWQDYSASDLEQAYGRHSLIMACVREIATSIAEPKIKAVEEGPDGEEDLKAAPAMALLNRPNKHYSFSDLMNYVTSRLMLTGSAYVWKWRYKNRREVGELWPVPTSWVTLKEADDNRLVESYRVLQGKGQYVDVPPEDMIAFWLVDPATMRRGVAPLNAAMHDYQLDVERQNYLVEMIDNGRVPGMRIKSEQPFPFTEDQKVDIRASLDDQAGRGKRGSPLLLWGGMSVEDSIPLKDLDWPGLTGLTEARITSAFGVPPIIVGARIGLEFGTYANYDAARRSFYMETLKPLWGMLGDGFTRGLCADEGDERTLLRFDLANVAELQEDLAVKHLRVRADFQAGLLTRGQALKLLGYELVSDADDVYLLPIMMIPTPPIRETGAQALRSAIRG